jgi:hypothetical protein
MIAVRVSATSASFDRGRSTGAAVQRQSSRAKRRTLLVVSFFRRNRSRESSSGGDSVPAPVPEARLSTSQADPVEVSLWRADAVVLFDWLMSTDLNTVPIAHPAQKQALADLLARLEETDVSDSSHADIAGAQSDVAKNMGW